MAIAINTMSRPAVQRGPSALELVEESVQLLRRLPLSCWLSYYLGTVPFLIALLYFWVEMSSGGRAELSCLPGSILLAPLFVGMKMCQTIFSCNLRRRFGGQHPLAWSVGRVCRMACVQGAVQPFRLFVLPIALIITLPFPWTFAFFENLTTLGEGDRDGFFPDIQRAAAQAKVWPGQNHLLVFILFPIAIVTWLNVVLGCLSLPYLLKWFLGIDTLFTRAPGSVFLNTTFFAVAVCLTYLVVDPLVKAIYSLRCFYGEARQDGADLMADIALVQQRLSQWPLAAMVFLLLVSPLSITAGVTDLPSPPPQKDEATAPLLDRAIDDTLSQKKYQWRMPRTMEERPEDASNRGFLRSLQASLKKAFNLVLDAISWLRRRWIGEDSEPTDSNFSSPYWKQTLHGFGFGILILAALVSAWLLWRARRNSRRKNAPLHAQVLPVIPDLQDEAVIASQLPEEGWLQLAREWMEKGDFRLALRAFFLASLAHLAHREMVTLARFKSNRDYLSEIGRRGRHLPILQASFAENVATFERSWYGLHEVTLDLLNQFNANFERMRSC